MFTLSRVEVLPLVPHVSMCLICVCCLLQCQLLLYHARCRAPRPRSILHNLSYMHCRAYAARSVLLLACGTGLLCCYVLVWVRPRAPVIPAGIPYSGVLHGFFTLRVCGVTWGICTWLLCAAYKQCGIKVYAPACVPGFMLLCMQHPQRCIIIGYVA
jgi:hypothetical protein